MLNQRSLPLHEQWLSNVDHDKMSDLEPGAELHKHCHPPKRQKRQKRRSPILTNNKRKPKYMRKTAQIVLY